MPTRAALLDRHASALERAEEREARRVAAAYRQSAFIQTSFCSPKGVEMPYKNLIKGLQEGSEKLQLDLSRANQMVSELNTRLLHNEGALMLAMNLQEEAETAQAEEAKAAEEARVKAEEQKSVEVQNAEPKDPIRSVESLAAARRVPNGAAKRDPAGVAVAPANA